MGVVTMNPKKLIDTINVEDLLNGDEHGIFQTIYDIDSNLVTPNFPWLTEDLSFLLDNDYYTIRSADKWISKQFVRYLKLAEDGIIGVSPLVPLANYIMNRFADKWNKLHSAFLESTYNPLENYDMEEKTTPDLTRTKNVQSSMKSENGIFGFNSSTKVPQSENVTSGNKLDNEETEKHTGTNTLTRHGNIGVTTSQQMLQSEIDLRSNFNFMNEIMNDVDSILCLLVY